MDPRDTVGKPPRGSAVSEKRIGPWYWAAAIGLTVAVRLYLFLNYYTINNDGVLYIRDARYFFNGQWADGLASFYPPLFPLMVAAVYPLVGNWESAGRFWPATAGIFTLFPLFGLMRRIYGDRVAALTLLFYGISPYLARLSLEVRSESVYVFFVVLTLYCLQRALDENGSGSFFWAGASAASAYLVRPEGAGLMIVATLFLLHRRRHARRAGRGALPIAWLAVGFCLVATPYILYLKWDSGHWVMSRKTGLILSMGLARYDGETERVSMEDSSSVDWPRLIQQKPGLYLEKVSLDLFRSLGFYFEALHYSYLLFLVLGWFVFFRERARERSDLLLAWTVAFYLATFALLYITRRYGIPLAAISLGWVAVGYLFLKNLCATQWPSRGRFVIAAVVVLFVAGTLPKTLHAIGEDKFYLRRAGEYLKAKEGKPTIIATDARVGFYAEGNNRVLRMRPSSSEAVCQFHGDYLAIDAEILRPMKRAVSDCGWVADREFSWDEKDRLWVLRRKQAS